jgi:hypothetical protein
MWLLRLLFKPVGFVLAGLAVAGIGGFMAWNGNTAKPLERNELAQIEGSVQKVTMTWREKRGTKRNIEFNVDVKSANGQTVELVMPDEQIKEAQAQNIDGAQITALVNPSNKKEVWELVSQGQKVISYEDSRKAEIKSLTAQASMGPYAAGGGALVFLIGLFRLRGRKKG